MLKSTPVRQQATELDTKKREAILHKIQQKVYDEALFIPIFELGFLCASGPGGRFWIGADSSLHLLRPL